ncbi:PadR family transcriptional regulator [Bermanella marisrubri]|uniref:Transcriptional regulator n=1 Tax=Bermanella marisrubri TaxID=207949 RepID=Q1N1T0_9GAMM|nr:PadR family transcriptional regulator [Bermanella marisrubri]EAT12201.1 hypothetical protein RED65_04225 [Oceanobacter sp. RED65] [Bermanella marisrubri]QIZ83672.1 PadR family transcriptional regulator [Bermanella marisrubri]
MSLKHAILTLLETEEGSGYDLLKRFKSRLGYFWNASHQQIYAQLKAMREQGLLEYDVESQHDRPDRKVYRVTDKGHKALLDWIAQPVKIDKVNDALLVKLYAGHLTDNTSLLNEVQQHKLVHQRMLQTFLDLEQDYLALSPEQKPQYTLPYLTLRRGILGEQAWLEWAREVETFLAKNT